ncbi:MAG: cysteine-rich CWC family protein [Nitrospira sp.]|nr:cysteine-rich CWC family protein [Nitrospira sp.]
MDNQRQKSCSRCGATFECLSGHGCWCQDVSLTCEHLRWIESHYDNCLCPACLKAVGQEQGSGVDGNTVVVPDE